jgi:DNA-binding LacI/PurR family transcriptional regulator
VPVRIEDVARVAGVSTATVSRALRGLPSVSEQTKQTVHRVAADLGYVVSRSASSLASGRTMTVGVVTPYVSRWFYATVLEAVERELRGSGYDALLVGVGEPLTGVDLPFRAEMLRNRVDGVVVLTTPLTGRELDGVRALALPTVFIGSAVAGVTSVRIDDVAVGRTATEHLLRLGHRRIAHLGGDPQQPLNFSTPSDRRAGWMSALRGAGVEPDPAYDVFADFTTRAGYDVARRLLALAEPPTAVFAASDEMAFGVLLAARHLGVEVPAQLSVLGVDDHELSELVGLTTLAQPVTEQGALGARLVLEEISGDPSHRRQHVLLPVALRERVTTAAPSVTTGGAVT